MKSSAIAAAAIVAFALDASQLARADMKAEILDDEDHRYHLEITVAQKTAVGGSDMPTIFCLAPTLEDKIEVCLGAQQGHSFFAGVGMAFVYKPNPDGNPACRCERPVILRADQPFCWPMSVSVPAFRGTSTTIAGFVTILEDVNEIGGRAKSCVNVESKRVPLRVTDKKGNASRPPTGTPARNRGDAPGPVPQSY